MAGANVAATEAVGTIPGQTHCRIGTRHSVVLFAHAVAVTRAAPALVIRVGIVRNGSTCPVDAAAFFRRRARHAIPLAPAIATHAVGTIPRSALRRRNARGAIDPFRLRIRTRPRRCAAAADAFVVRIGRCGNRSTNTVIAAALLFSRASRALVHTNVVAAKPVDAIPRQTLGRHRAAEPVVISAIVAAVACAAPTFIVRVGIIRNRSTNSIGTCALFGRTARHAFVVASSIATNAVDAKRRWTISRRRTRHARQCLDHARFVVIARQLDVPRPRYGIRFVLEFIEIRVSTTGRDHRHHGRTDDEKGGYTNGSAILAMHVDFHGADCEWQTSCHSCFACSCGSMGKARASAARHGLFCA